MVLTNWLYYIAITCNVNNNVYSHTNFTDNNSLSQENQQLTNNFEVLKTLLLMLYVIQLYVYMTAFEIICMNS